MQLQDSKKTKKIPTFPQFKQISAIDRDIYENRIKKYDPYSDYNYTSLYVWGRENDNLISDLNGNIVLSIQGYMDDKKALSFLGKNLADDTALKLLDYAKHNKEYYPSLQLVPEYTIKYLDKNKFLINEDRDNHDYILFTSLFYEMSGSKFSHMRRKVSQFSKNYSNRYDTRMLKLNSQKDRHSVLRLSYEWAFMGTEGSISAHEELSAITRFLSDLHDLNKAQSIYSIGLFIDGGLQGYCIFEISHSYATIHFIKTNLEFIGSADFLMRHVMYTIEKKFKVSYVNHEQDLGIMGLRFAKIRYCPTGFLKKYVVENKK